MELLEIEDTHRVDEPRRDGRVRPAPRARTCGCATTSSRSRSPSPRASRSRSTATCCAWQNWSLRIGFNHREGMVLHTVGYDDGGRIRSVAHRLSFAEMVVPYRDPTPDHYRRTAFDIGEWGLGFMTTSLELGCDCLGEIRYLDAVLHDTHGRAVHDHATRSASTRRTTRVLWKHVDHADRRRGRAGCAGSCVSFHVTVANYEYLVYWRFYQDGNIECEVRATGIMVTTHFARGRAAAVRHARRRAHLRAVPPALPRRPARPGRRRRATTPST